MEFPRLSGLIALDTETRDPFLKKQLGPGWCFGGERYGNIVGVSVAWTAETGDVDSIYLPIRHETGQNLPEQHVLRWVDDLLHDPSIEVAYHNRLYDRGWLRRSGVNSTVKEHDTTTMVALDDEYRHSYSLDNCARDYVGEGKDETGLREFAKQHKLNPKSDIYRMPGHVVAPYATQDARATLLLAKKLLPVLAADGLMTIYDLEMRLIPLLLEMRWRGVRVDEGRAEQVRKGLLQREKDALKALQTLAGCPVDVWANRSLGRAADKLGVKYPLTAKRKDPSFTKDWLRAQSEMGNEFARLVWACRKFGKVRSTFIDGHVFAHAVNGRIHTQFHPIRSDEGGAVTGRFSSSDPNLQQLPNKEEEQSRDDAILVRGLFLPEEGQLWSSCDWSQQEPRLAVHYADLMGCEGAHEAAERYRKDPTTHFHKMVAELMGLQEEYGRAKILNLAVMYGEGGAKLCKQLGLPTKWITKGERHLEVAGEEGQAIIDEYHRLVPFMKRIADLVSRRAKKVGMIWTLGGRRRRFAQEQFNPETRRWKVTPETAHYAFAFKAFNALIQGSAADQMKMAMVMGYEQYDIVPLVTVHDELGVNSDDADNTVKCMNEAVTLRVPMLVDRADGVNWGATL